MSKHNVGQTDGANTTIRVKQMEQTTQCGSNNTMWVKQMEQTTQSVILVLIGPHKTNKNVMAGNPR